MIEIPDERVRGVVANTNEQTAGIPLKQYPELARRNACGGKTERDSKAGANPVHSPLPGWPKASDKWNYAYAQYLEQEKQDGRIIFWWYEPASFWLPGKVRYKPDFLIWRHIFGRLEYIEVKGWSKNRRDGVTRYKIAASLWPCFAWKMVKRKGYGWEEIAA